MRATSIDALRRSALLATSLPGIRIRLSHEGQSLAIVDGTGGRRVVDGMLHLGTGAFRRAVAARLAPSVVGRQGGHARSPRGRRAGDPHRRRRLRHGAARQRVGRAPSRRMGLCIRNDAGRRRRGIRDGHDRRRTRRSSHPAAGAGLGTRIDLHHDEDLATTLVWTEAQPDPCPTRDAATMSIVNDALAACAVAELDTRTAVARRLSAATPTGAHMTAAFAPPSTFTAAPVTNRACSLHRKATICPKSPGSPVTPAGMPTVAAAGSSP